MSFKHLFPSKIRLAYAIGKRKYRDINAGFQSQWAKTPANGEVFPCIMTITQPVKKTQFFENKVNNIDIAGRRIGKLIIKEGEIFSFWKTVGMPARRNGYKKGRNIISGKLIEDYGGGLCQLSGIIYFLALKAGLQIIERHNHSVDIYTEVERFAPLGSDATVVYGYKDLRIKNNFPFTLNFDFEINGDELTAYLKSDGHITERNILFERIPEQTGEKVLTKWIREKGEEIITISTYKGEG